MIRKNPDQTQVSIIFSVTFFKMKDKTTDVDSWIFFWFFFSCQAQNLPAHPATLSHMYAHFFFVDPKFVN
jgi:hypothetical protein